MDIDGDGSVEEMDIPMESGVTFDPGFTWTDITFIRGRLPGEIFFK